MVKHVRKEKYTYIKKTININMKHVFYVMKSMLVKENIVVEQQKMK